MEQRNIPYSEKRKPPIKREPFPEVNEEDMVFSVDLKLGKADRTGERKMIRGVRFDRGVSYIIEDGVEKKMPYHIVGAFVLENNMENRLTPAQRHVLGIDKLLDKKN